MKRLFAFIVLCVLLAAPAFSKDKDAELMIRTVQQQIPILDLKKSPDYSKDVHKYFSYYGLSIEQVEHFFGKIKAGKWDIAVHIFKPAESTGVVLLVHGYYDHAGIWKHIIPRLLKEKLTVVVYDQPGHGLSSGERAAIDDFSEYTDVYKTALKLCKSIMPGKTHVVAHSMGCAPVFDTLLVSDGTEIGEVVFLAPLIRSVAWGLSGFGNRLMGSTIKSVPRKYRNNSSDKAFKKFMKQDPLHAERLPMTWVKAHREWVESVELSKSTSKKKIKVIQGSSDSTVKWKHNIPLLQKRFTNIDVSILKKAGHQLLNESDKFRNKSINLVMEYLLRVPEDM